MVTARRAGRQGGFTLTELMTAVAVLAILAGMAAPAYSSWVASTRTGSAGTDLHTALTLARSEAIKRNAEVTLEPAGDGWQSGWQIAAPGDADRLLLEHPALRDIGVDGPDSVTYLPNGRTKGGTLPAFEIGAADGPQRCVSVDLSGRPRLAKSTCVNP